MMSTSPELLFAKTNTRKMSRELIRVVFLITEQVPPNEFKVDMRKKTLSISSFISHATVQVKKETQSEYFLAIMNEIREVLNLLKEGKAAGFITDKMLSLFRLSISDLINALDQLTKLLGCFD